MQTIANASAYCKDWRVYKPVKGDKLTQKSAAELLASNEARHKSWGCKKLKNEAA